MRPTFPFTLCSIAPAFLVALTCASRASAASTPPEASLPGAELNHAYGVAAGREGNIYIADTLNSVIRKLDRHGTLSVIAGKEGETGMSDGPAADARFLYPSALAVDDDGTVYVADTANHTIRKITPGGMVTTLAGKPRAAGDTDGIGAAARLNFPAAIAVGPGHRLYFTQSFTIRTVSPDGEVRTLAGVPGKAGAADGPGPQARFFSPDGITVSSDGTAYVSDSENWTIRRIAPDGTVSTLAGKATLTGTADGVGDQARFTLPTGITLAPGGVLYVADTWNRTIRRITRDGAVSTVAGTAGSDPGWQDGPAPAARFHYPCGLAADAEGNIYIADVFNSAIRRLDATGRVTTLAKGAGANALVRPSVPAAAGPAITREPDNATVFTGEPVQFLQEAKGAAPLTYAWQIFRPRAAAWETVANSANISGAAGPALSIRHAAASDSGAQFRCVVTDPLHRRAFSNTATLTVASAAQPTRGGPAVAWIPLTESSEAFRNPMKGFRPARQLQMDAFPRHDYATVYKNYIGYNNLESKASDSVQKIKDWSNHAWRGIEAQNVKVIPRVVLYQPGEGEFWPEDMPHVGPPYAEVNWTSEAFKQRLVAFIAKLGAAWDDDPRVAAIELGLWGKWGEHHIDPTVVSNQAPDPVDPTRIPPAFQKALGDAAVRAFPHKKVLIRYPGDTFRDYQFGTYWDSFALPEDTVNGLAVIEKNDWDTQMNSGEIAFDWGTQAAVGGSPDAALADTDLSDNIIGWIYATHTSSLGWISDYTQHTPAIEQNAGRMQKALGYRFVIAAARVGPKPTAGAPLSVAIQIANQGAAPFYYPWPLRLHLLGPDRNPIWSTVLAEDIRRWRPGEIATREYEVTLPAGLARGTYILALSIDDPAANKPALRFANRNYYRGGFTPIARIALDGAPPPQDLGPFDSLKGDDSLTYTP